MQQRLLTLATRRVLDASRLRAHVLLLITCCAVGAACSDDPPKENTRPARDTVADGIGDAEGDDGTDDDDVGMDAGKPDDQASQATDGNADAGSQATSGDVDAGDKAEQEAGGDDQSDDDDQGDSEGTTDNTGTTGIVDEGATTGSFSRRDLLEAAARCAIAQYEAFRDDVASLVDASDALADDPDDAKLATARDRWRAAMASWQRAELFGFGPAARSSEPGGMDLRDQIYAFPLANACLIDRQLVSGVYADSGFGATLVTARGMSAIEYLLFHAGDDNACSASGSINTDGSWQALVAELPVRRAEYAHAAAADVLSRVEALLDAWDPGGDNFIQSFVEPGAGQSVFESELDALDALHNALFYVELDVKDTKLGTPLGIGTGCPNAPSPCPDAVESPFAQASTDNLRENLIGARRLFEGCGADNAGLGFDDWLEAEGEEALATRMLDALEAAITALDALDAPLEEVLVSDPAKAQALYDAIKGFTDPLKTEMVSILMVSLPATAQGDND